MKRLENQIPILFKNKTKVTHINKWKPPSYFLGVRMLGNIAQHETGLFGDNSSQYKSDFLLAEKLGFKNGIVHGWKFKIYNNNFCVTLDYWGQWPTFNRVFDDAIVIFKELDLLC